MKAEVYPSPDGWRFRVVGEAYVRRIDAESALRTLFANGRDIEVTVRDHHTNIADHYHLGAAGAQDELPLEEGDDDADRIADEEYREYQENNNDEV